MGSTASTIRVLIKIKWIRNCKCTSLCLAHSEYPVNSSCYYLILIYWNLRQTQVSMSNKLGSNFLLRCCCKKLDLIGPVVVLCKLWSPVLWYFVSIYTTWQKQTLKAKTGLSLRNKLLWLLVLTPMAKCRLCPTPTPVRLVHRETTCSNEMPPRGAPRPWALSPVPLLGSQDSAPEPSGSGQQRKAPSWNNQPFCSRQSLREGTSYYLTWSPFSWNSEFEATCKFLPAPSAAPPPRLSFFAPPEWSHPSPCEDALPALPRLPWWQNWQPRYRETTDISLFPKCHLLKHQLTQCFSAKYMAMNSNRGSYDIT